MPTHLSLTHSFGWSSDKYTLSISYVPGTDLMCWGQRINKTKLISSVKLSYRDKVRLKGQEHGASSRKGHVGEKTERK
jgi:hypothetical protein